MYDIDIFTGSICPFLYLHMTVFVLWITMSIKLIECLKRVEFLIMTQLTLQAARFQRLTSSTSVSRVVEEIVTDTEVSNQIHQMPRLLHDLLRPLTIEVVI